MLTIALIVILALITGTIIALLALPIRGGTVEPVNVHQEEEL